MTFLPIHAFTARNTGGFRPKPRCGSSSLPVRVSHTRQWFSSGGHSPSFPLSRERRVFAEPALRLRRRPARSPAPGLRVPHFVWRTGQRKGRFHRVPRTRGPQRTREQVKRRDVGPGRSEEGVGAQVPLHVGRGRRMAEPGNGGMRHELAPFRSEARAPESAPDRLGERGEPGLRRGAGPERAGSAARGKNTRGRAAPSGARAPSHHPGRTRFGAAPSCRPPR